jgi:3',5'-cyclic AMP phosphodiesterase CpdA
MEKLFHADMPTGMSAVPTLAARVIGIALMAAPFTLIHISDVHVHGLPRDPRQWLSKRALGGLNLLLNRRRRYPPARMRALVADLDGMAWDQLVLSGDVTQLATEGEFARARALLAPLLARGPGRVTVIPGNHDRYVDDRGGRDGFGDAFGEYFAPYGGHAGMTVKPLCAGWWLCGWDSARPVGWLSAEGAVPEATLAATEAWLETLPPGDKVVLVNHYPLHFPPGFHRKRRHDLVNLAAVRERVAAWPVRLYLHGHDHHNWVVTRPVPGGTLTLVNSASSSQVPRRGQTSSYHRIRLDGDSIEVEPMALSIDGSATD